MAYQKVKYIGRDTGLASGEVIAKIINEWIEKKKQEDSNFKVVNVSYSSCADSFGAMILYESTYDTP